MPEKFNIPQTFQGSIVSNQELSSFTSFKIGGCTPLFIQPASINDLIAILNAFNDQKTDFFVLGGGSNLVIADEGIPVPVISTGSFDHISSLVRDDGAILLSCGSGLSVERIIQYCIDTELSGLENFAGLPGSVGGAVYMNARCYEKSVSDSVYAVRYVENVNGRYREYSYTYCAHDWDYKKSPFQHTKKIITGVDLIVTKGEKESITEKCRVCIDDRKEKGHFRYPSAGSVFKNNRDFGKPSGKIIDEAGLKGLRIGGTQIAPWHGNFIVNVDQGKASEVKELVTVVQNTVFEKFGFFLEPEIIFTQDLF